MAANPGKETIGAHANCANALNKSIIPLLELLLVLLLLFPVILLRVSKEECFVGILCALSPFALESVCIARHACRDDTESDEGNVPVVYVVVYVVLASDPRAKDLSACERESKTQEKESLSRLFSRSSRVVLSHSLLPSFASPAIRLLR